MSIGRTPRDTVITEMRAKVTGSLATGRTPN
ncbi:hypothetical protein JOC34_002807 [Virgibacillus halotolerans]|nr:hypothetical protein [Virgibacillus halotolerans]